MEENKDVFKAARDQAVKNAIEKAAEETKDALPDKAREKTIAIIKERIEEGETQWDLLKKMIDGSMTEKFISIIHDMPDRDFVRNYLKLLEHFKPKVGRIDDGGQGSVDTTINITTLIVNSQGETEVRKLQEIGKEIIIQPSEKDV